MTTETDTEPTVPAGPAPDREPITDRLPDDHPAARALAKANKEAEALRFKLQEITDRDKTELQKLLDGIAERDAKLVELPRVVRAQVIRFASAAASRGFVDAEDALMLLGDIDIADAAAVAAALDALAARKPHLVREHKRVPARPRPDNGVNSDTDSKQTKGKERAAAALRQFRSS